jgi:UDP-glucose 4-epimerase
MGLYLVTGGAGFIGSNLTAGLIARGERVRVLDDLSTGRRANLAGLGDQVDLGALPSVQRSVEDPVTSNAVNVGGTLHVLLAARAAGVRRVVFASSSSVYGDAETLPKVETMAPAPLSPYAVQKLTGEHYGRIAGPLFGVEVVSLRFFNVFGPRQDPKSDYAAVIPRFITAYLRGEPPVIFGDGLQSRDFTFVENVVEANLLAMRASREAVGEAINVACGERYTLLELADEIGKATGRSLMPRHGPARKGDVRHSQASIEKARALLGFEPKVGFAEGLARTIRFYQGA